MSDRRPRVGRSAMDVSVVAVTVGRSGARTALGCSCDHCTCDAPLGPSETPPNFGPSYVILRAESTVCCSEVENARGARRRGCKPRGSPQSPGHAHREPPSSKASH